MAVTRQLYELQVVDDNIEQTRRTLDLKKKQLNNREALEQAAAILAGEQKILEELKKLRRDAEAEVTDINAKINEANKQLYGGRITNPKELSALQADVNQLTSQKDIIETRGIAVIEKLEDAEKKVTTISAALQKAEANWTAEQAQITKDIELLTKTLAALQMERLEAAGKIDAQALALYERVRRMKKPAVARVEQGICKACRLSLSASALQKARGGHPVQCGTCGRILFVS